MTTTFLHGGLKSVDAQSRPTQALSATRIYDAFGNATASSGTWRGPFGYGGGYGYQEDATGLRLLGHRFYDPSIGRFLTRDPVKDGRNWYVYCENDPVNGADPEGLVSFAVGFIVVSVISIGVGAWYWWSNRQDTQRRRITGRPENVDGAIAESVGVFNQATGVEVAPIHGLDALYQAVPPIVNTRARTRAMQAYVDGEDDGSRSDYYEQGDKVVVYDSVGNFIGRFGNR